MFADFIKAFFALFVVMDPLGNLSIFAVLMGKLTSKERKVNSAEAAAVAALVLFIFMFFGDSIMHLFGVTCDAFKFAGGLVLMILGLKLVLGLRLIEKRAEKYDIAVVPLAVPLITGPGSIITIMVLAQQIDIFSVFLAALANLFITWIVLRNSARLLKIFGRQGSDGLARIMGLIICAIAAGFIRSGWFGM